MLLNSEQGTWSANIINCVPNPTALSQNTELKSYYCQRHEPNITIVEEEERKTLWNQKLEEIITFQRERPMQEISKQQSKKLIAIYNEYQHVFSNIPGTVSYTHLDVYKRQRYNSVLSFYVIDIYVYFHDQKNSRFQKT